MPKRKPTPDTAPDKPTPDSNEPDLSGLTDKQRAFVLNYARTLNATRAAIAAGYSEKTAYSVGSENLRKPEIRKAIDALLAKTIMSQDELKSRLAAQARADIGDFIDPQSMMVDFRRAQELGITHLIKRIKQTVITTDDKQTEIFELELHDSQKALGHLSRIYGMVNETVDGKIQVEVVYQKQDKEHGDGDTAASDENSD